jgi:hypothetical protein
VRAVHGETPTRLRYRLPAPPGSTLVRRPYRANRQCPSWVLEHQGPPCTQYVHRYHLPCTALVPLLPW